MTDIVQRLRDRASQLAESERPLSDATIAADEIERLRGVLEWYSKQAIDDDNRAYNALHQNQ